MGRHLWKTPYPYIPINILIFMVLVTNVAVNHISQTVDLPIIREVENTAITTAITKMPGSKHSIVKGFKPSMYQQTAVRKYAEAVWIRELKLQLRNAPIQNLRIDKFQITFPGPLYDRYRRIRFLYHNGDLVIANRIFGSL